MSYLSFFTPSSLNIRGGVKRERRNLLDSLSFVTRQGWEKRDGQVLFCSLAIYRISETDSLSLLESDLRALFSRK